MADFSLSIQIFGMLVRCPISFSHSENTPLFDSIVFNISSLPLDKESHTTSAQTVPFISEPPLSDFFSVSS